MSGKLERKRILFAIPELDAAGPDRVFFEVISGIDRSYFEPHLAVVNGGGRYFTMLPEDVERHIVGGGRYPAYRFARLVDRLKPNLICSTLRMNWTAAMARFLQRHKPPLVARQANAIDLAFSELKKSTLIKHRVAEFISTRFLRVPEFLIAQSSDMAKELSKRAAMHQRIIVIGNPVSVGDIVASMHRQVATAKPEPAGQPSLVAVGRLAPQKGFDILLPAFTRFRQDYPDAGLTIFGEGPDRARLEQMTRDLGIESAVQFPGVTNNVLAEVSAAEILVSSSRYEGFSNAILEAMALACPIVATNCEGATKDMILDGETGVLVEAFDEDSLAAGLIRIMRKDRRILGSKARRHVQEHFGRQKILASYQQCFERALTREHV